ncbi:hypothetical protein K438DRAFT_2007839 [Mycena galopus ATCC 62051]|nr:hypothetical protein K438DRAFT_2007839 [Mycena galopus ATCC 62051]
MKNIWLCTTSSLHRDYQTVCQRRGVTFRSKIGKCGLEQHATCTFHFSFIDSFCAGASSPPALHLDVFLHDIGTAPSHPRLAARLPLIPPIANSPTRLPHPALQAAPKIPGRWCPLGKPSILSHAVHTRTLHARRGVESYKTAAAHRPRNARSAPAPAPLVPRTRRQTPRRARHCATAPSTYRVNHNATFRS